MYDKESFDTSKAGQDDIELNLNGAHMPHGALARPLELYARKIDSL